MTQVRADVPLGRALGIVVTGLVTFFLLPYLAFVGMAFVGVLNLSGALPGHPLGSYHREIVLQNGATLLLDGREYRTIHGDGFTEQISYKSPGSGEPEYVGGWEQSRNSPRVYFAGPLLVVVAPDGEAVYVRTHVVEAVPAEEVTPGEERSNYLYCVPNPRVECRWRTLSMLGWGAKPFRLRMNGDWLSLPDRRRIWNDLDEEEEEWQPSAVVQGFDARDRELVILQRTPTSRRLLKFILSPDGTELALSEIERIPVERNATRDNQ
jgi:hypothetical protein